MSSELKKRNIPFSPPDMSEEEARMATEAILSGWITTGPKTKEFERKQHEYAMQLKQMEVQKQRSEAEVDAIRKRKQQFKTNKTYR